MQIITITSLSEQVNTAPCAVALGNFDGVHLGHQSLLKRAKDSTLPSAVFTFSEEVPQFLTTQSERCCLFEKNGVELLFLAPFSLFKDLSCRDFVRYLTEKLACRHVICGYNFRFGKGAVGNADTLCALADELSLSCSVMPEAKYGTRPISSSAIRALLADGKVEDAADLLGRPYAISGQVEKGYSLGKRLEVPTLNLRLPQGALVPKQGVYVSETIIDGKTYPAITNIGNNPTFKRDTITCETYLLDTEGDFYGKTIRVQLLSFLRAEKEFVSFDSLKEAIAHDLESAGAYHQNRS